MKNSCKLLLILGYLFFSCVYFNTFYNAENSYKKALVVIEESPILEDDKFPAQAKKLLGDAIDNSKIVLKKFPESKYVDDAIFIIAKASFLRGESAIAESYFKQLLREYPDSKYYELSEIWLAYTFLRMDLIDRAKDKIDIIVLKNYKDKEKKYLIYNILAEIRLIEQDIVDVYYNYEKAVEFAPSKSKQVSMLSKLILIAEENENKIKACDYLLDLADIAPDAIRVTSRMKWVQYQRELGNYEAVILEIQRLLSMSEFSSKYMQLELELGKVYKAKGDDELAKELFSFMIEKYPNKKIDEIAEVNYHLGMMAIMKDFNRDLALEYFENSKKVKLSSFYGRASKEMITKINKYESLVELYSKTIIDDDIAIKKENDIKLEENMTNNDAMKVNEKFSDKNFSTKDTKSEDDNISPDSLLFMIGEMLLYDFNHKELAFSKFKSLSDEYPGSSFSEKSLYVLSYFEPDKNWLSTLEEQYPFSNYLNPDSVGIKFSLSQEMEAKRDIAWLMGEKSYKDSYIEFSRLYEEFNDTLSGYIRAYISDYYLNDIKQAIQDYNFFLENYPDHKKSPRVEERLKIIEKDLEDQKAFSKQTLNYKNAIEYFKSSHDFDSTKIMLDQISNGEKSKYRDGANEFKSVMRKYDDLLSKIKNNLKEFDDEKSDSININLNNPESKIDSLLYVLANLFYYELELLDSAQFYYKQLISNYKESKFRANALKKSLDINYNENFKNILSSEYSDSLFIADSILVKSVYIENIFDEDYIKDHDELINICEEYLDFFVEETDSINNLIDSTDMSGIINRKNNNTDSSKIEFQKVIEDENLRTNTLDNIMIDRSVENIKSDASIDTLQISIDEPIIGNEIANIENNLISDDESDKGIILEYIVKKGETLYEIAFSELGDPMKWILIYEWNKDNIGVDSSLIFPYQILEIKSDSKSKEKNNLMQTIYLVQEGESLWDIAIKAYGDPYAWILIFYDNKKTIFKDPNQIKVNQQLIIRSN